MKIYFKNMKDDKKIHIFKNCKKTTQKTTTTTQIQKINNNTKRNPPKKPTHTNSA